MTTETLTLTDFLLARLAEDEAVAREAEPVDDRRGVEEGAEAWACRSQGWHVGMSPARVLAEVGAKRRIVEEYGERRWPSADEPLVHYITRADGHKALRILAAVYSDHPDFREEWRP